MKRSTWLALALATTALAQMTARAAAPVLPTGGKVAAGLAVIGAPPYAVSIALTGRP